MRCHPPWASYQIHKIAGCACAGNAENVSPHHWLQRKPLVSDPGLHHGTAWRTCHEACRDRLPGKFSGISGACAPAILLIWQELHGRWKGCTGGVWWNSQVVLFSVNHYLTRWMVHAGQSRHYSIETEPSDSHAGWNLHGRLTVDYCACF